MTLPSRLLAATCLVSAAVLTLGSCAGEKTGGDTGEEPEIGSIERISTTEGLETPASAYDIPPDQQYQLDKAQNVLIEQCMKRFGFEYTRRAPTPPSGDDSNSQAFGLASTEDAARFGYSRPDRAAHRTPATKQSRPHLSRLGQTVLGGVDPVAEAEAKAQGRPPSPTHEPMTQAEAEKAAGSGIVVNDKEVPVGGCGRESALKLYAPKPGVVDLLFVFGLHSEAMSRSLEDSRVQDAASKWSQCMADSGFTTSGPESVQSDVGLAEDELSSARAITIAKADVACKKKVNYVGVRYAVQSAYEKILVEEHAETLARFKKQTEARLRLAARLNGRKR